MLDELKALADAPPAGELWFSPFPDKVYLTDKGEAVIVGADVLPAPPGAALDFGLDAGSYSAHLVDADIQRLTTLTDPTPDELRCLSP